jgi:Mn2+/Fe2+ NRAMP family transporter
MHIFEFSVSILVLIVLVSFIVLIVNVQPDWGDTFRGYLPSRTMIVNGGLYLAVSIVGKCSLGLGAIRKFFYVVGKIDENQFVGLTGATVMPHSIFLGEQNGSPLYSAVLALQASF